MRRKFTIALAGALLSLGTAALFGAPAAQAAKRAAPMPAAKAGAMDSSARKPVAAPGWETSQFNRRYRPRYSPRWRRDRNRRRYGGRGGRGDNGGGNLMSMREAVRLVRSRVPGRIANAGLRGRFAWFRVISRGRVLNVTVDRMRRTLNVRGGY